MESKRRRIRLYERLLLFCSNLFLYGKGRKCIAFSRLQRLTLLCNTLVTTCPICGEEVYVGEIDDRNIRKLYDEYRKEEGILSTDEIREIPEMYNISKKKLSKILGWGDNTFSRYYDGKTPSKRYSDILKELKENPARYIEILEDSKELIKQKEYQKSKEAALKVLKLDKRNKIIIAAEYIINKCNEVTPLALQKMLYYIRGFYMAFYKAELFEDDCEAWVHGPVYREIYNQFKEYKYHTIEIKDEINSELFTNEEIEILDSICENFGCYSGTMLELFTHDEDPWKITRGELDENEKSDKVIDKKIIKEYFTKVIEEYDIKKTIDIGKYSYKMFMKKKIEH